MASMPRLIFLLNSAQRRLQARAAAEHGGGARTGDVPPTAAQGGVLFVLSKGDGSTMGELAAALDLVPSAVSGLVQRMEALGWVRRSTCPGDARTQRVWLQPAGTALLPDLRSAVNRLNAQLADGFSDAELQTVARWLQHVQTLRLPAAGRPEGPSR